MIKTVFSDRTEDKKKIFTAYDTNYKPIWYSKEYRFDTELVKQEKDYIVFRTNLGYEAYNLITIEGEVIAEELDYKTVMNNEEIEKFNKYYKNIHPNPAHPEADFTPEEAYKLYEMADRVDEHRQILNEKLLRNEKIIYDQENELKEIREELIQLRQEREEQYKKLQELQQIADNLNSDKTKYDIEIIKRMKKAESQVKYYEDFYEHWAKWYAKNKVAIQTLKHEKMIKTAIILMIINIIMVIAIF